MDDVYHSTDGGGLVGFRSQESFRHREPLYSYQQTVILWDN